MNLRSLAIAVAVLVALSAAVWFGRRPPAPAAADPRIGQPVLPPATAAQAARVRLADGGRTVELVRANDGSWSVTSYYDFPADFAKLSRLIADLGEAKVRRLVTSRADRLARLEFKDSVLTLLDASGQEIWRATLGKTADGGGRFLRFGTEDKAYLADLSLWLDVEPKNWANPTLLDLKAGDIAKIEIGFTNDTPPAVTASRAKVDDPWAATAPPAGKRLRPDRVNAALSGLLTLRFTDTTAPDDTKAVAARAHARVFRLTTFDGTTYTLTFARTPEEKRPKPVAASSSANADAPASPAAAPDAPTSPAVAAGDATVPASPPAPSQPEFETIPAGPVFVSIASSAASARINDQMQKRAFQIGEWTYTGLPASPDEFWEPIPEAAPRPAAEPPEPKP